MDECRQEAWSASRCWGDVLKILADEQAACDVRTSLPESEAAFILKRRPGVGDGIGGYNGQWTPSLHFESETIS